MEEDIKVLEEFIKDINLPTDELLKKHINFDEIEQAIENIIKGYKKLEKENERIKNIDYYKLAEEFEMGLYMPRCDVEEYYVPIESLGNCIPKSKVREIIQNSYPDIAIQKLYELLEGDK